MAVYNVTLYDDMGIVSNDMLNNNVPRYIFDFVYEKVRQYTISTVIRSDSGGGMRFSCLKPNVEKQWSYSYGSDTVNITYDLLPYSPEFLERELPRK